MFNLENKVALVTGASSGIGKAIAIMLHRLGANIIMSGTNISNLEKLSEELIDRNHVIQCNLRETTEVSKLVDQANEIYGKLDILVCNAGITKDSLMLRMKVEDFEDVINVNLTANFIINKCAIKYMMKNRCGRIINISSIIASTGNIGQANYAASKAGLIAMSKSLATEVASRNITVNIVSPGFIETPMTDTLNDEHKENLLKSIPVGRFGRTEDIANTVAFLASDQASYITGQTIHVNGGMLMI